MLPPIADDFTVLLDTNVLVPPFLRDLLLNLAEAGVYIALFSEGILDELGRTLRLPRFKLSGAQADRILSLLREQFRDNFVCDYERIQVSFKLPDADDLHVLQAALKGRAQQIVTYNLNDFPVDELGTLEL